ncbi:MAG: hypothetical protein AAF385_17210 [Pseudomonadota bacterium]
MNWVLRIYLLAVVALFFIWTEPHPDSYDIGVALNAWLPIKEGDGAGLSAKLGKDAVKEANENGQMAARYFAYTCTEVKFVDVSGKSTKNEIVYFAQCGDEVSPRFVTLSEVEAWASDQ